MKQKIYQIDAFANKLFEGNPAMVCPLEEWLSDELTQLIEQEQGLFIAKDGDEVLAHVMSASWQFWSKWAMFQHMINDLPDLEYKGVQLSVENSYQYGPICIDKSMKGT